MRIGDSFLLFHVAVREVTKKWFGRLFHPKIRVMFTGTAILFATMHLLTYIPAQSGIEFTGPARWTHRPRILLAGDRGSRTSTGAGGGVLMVDPPGKLIDLPTGFELSDITIDYESVEADVGRQVHLVYMIERPVKFARGYHDNQLKVSGSIQADTPLKASTNSALSSRWSIGGKEVRGTKSSIAIPDYPANRSIPHELEFYEQTAVIRSKTETSGSAKLQQLFSVVLSPTATGQHFGFHYDYVR